MKYLLFIAFLLTIFSSVFSQSPVSKQYPSNYFRDPLNIPISLAANFGELRTNHFHMGLDIRTEKRENLPVYAAADGYVSRIKIEPEGFGQAIYINHPNGFTTVYAHLNSFFPALADYIKKKQYKLETWKIFLDLPPEMFPVKKGNVIAHSGNTGGSEGPHLHFEIRRTSDDTNLNPMLFGLPIPDNTKPVIQRLAVYDLNQSIYEQTPRSWVLKKSEDGNYTIIPDTITISASKTGFAITAFDTQSASSNPNGIYEAVLYDNEQAVLSFQMDAINYNDTRNVNAHIDYKTRAQNGPWLQQLFELPGYKHSIYHLIGGNGVIDISDGTVHSIRIEVKDAYGNSSCLKYKIRYVENGSNNHPAAGKMFYPMMVDGYEDEDCAFYIGEKCLYDSVHIQYSNPPPLSPGAVSMAHSIGALYIPLQDPFMVRIKTNRPAERNRILMERFDRKKKEVKKPEWQGDWASARFQDFGNFQLVLDEEPPVITPHFKEGANLSRASGVAFTIKDNFDSYKNFRAELDGKWLLFTNDKGKAFIYKFDEHCPRGKHQLKISVEDEAGNKTIKTFKFIR